MLKYLVTSKVRRRLLTLLWGEKAQGSAGELAQLAGVALASANVELHAMEHVRLVVSHREGRREVYSANEDHPDAAALRVLVASDVEGSFKPTQADAKLKRSLKALGAPLRGVDALEVAPAAELKTLVEGVALARRDPVVARSLPLCFWKLRNSLDAKALGALAARPEDKHGVGFFLDLTSALGKDRRLLGLAELLRDKRMTSVREFFQPPPPPRAPDSREPFGLARKWGFEMNMDLASFQSLFDRFASAETSR